ncbi:MAG: DUF192 domain-containing protein [Paraglaciecola sp.]|uniref:DUF192 domain-containing protein n=1 Tax=Paraglaciecola sp. TaxID=1920173 RepID=UPI00273F154C|nr:DUF192 domain-containing protein [Paraglaciecola sp.]MDP5032346.1 DUF192 domain-containing protein [Paraglaciecola sp.]MDP5133210.1 DUF192 domain-containing protein [Paraglaciecola sp.]
MKIRVLLLSLLFCLSVSAQSLKVTFPPISVEVKGQTYTLEYANSFELRSQGLMYRKSMCENCGMIFNFNQVKTAGMWMRNTFIPLDVAFIKRDGTITDIKAMQPHDESTITSSEKVLYAWEMNQGWFKQNNIAVGDKVTIQETTTNID